MNDLFLWDVVIAWRDHILGKDAFRKNKIYHLSHLSRIIANGLLDVKQPLSEFLKTCLEDKIRIINQTNEWSESTKQARRTTLRSFCRFAKENKVKPARVVIPFNELKDIQHVIIGELLSSNEDKAKSQSLTDKNITCFFNEMFKLNPRDGLATWMMWELKRTIHQILDLKIRDIDLVKGVIIFGDELCIGNLLPELKRCIQEQGKGKSAEELLFTTEKGNRIHVGQLVRNMKAASLRAKLPIVISPKILYAHAKAYSEKTYKELSEAERNLVFKDYAQKVISFGEKLKNMFEE